MTEKARLFSCFSRLYTYVLQPSRRWLVALIGLSVSLLVASYVGVRLYRDWSTLAQYNLTIRWEWVGLAVLAQVIGILLAVLSFRLVLLGFGEYLNYRAGLKIFFLSNLGGLLPGSIWALGSRVFLSERQGITRKAASAGMVLDFFLLGFAAFYNYLVAGFFVGLDNGLWDIRWLAAGFILGLVALYPPVFQRFIGWAVRRQGQVRPEVQLPEILTWLILDVVVIFLGGLGLYFMSVAIADVNISHLGVAIQAWSGSIVVANFLFWMPGTLVVREGITLLILSRIVPAPIALIIVLAWRISATVVTVLGAALTART
ncbi:MAG: hypothetical protein EXR62_06085 [Chloroflexi bacterium]|nr:hypothetical protein [Chloroflexota bacterium]